MDFAEGVSRTLLKIHIGENEIHFQTRRTTDRISMAHQQFAQSKNIFGGLQSVKIVRLLIHRDTGRAKLLAPLPVAHADTAPVIALEQHQWLVEKESLSRREFPAPLQNGSIYAKHWL